MADNNFVDRVAGKLLRGTRSTANSETIKAKIGNGENPPVVLVPDTESPDGKWGWFYCYRMIDRTKEVIVVKNTYPGIAYSEASAGIDVLIGYPPQSDTLSILGVDPALINQQTGGLLPSQIADLEAAQVTPDRFRMHQITAQGSLIVKYTGWFWRLGSQGRKFSVSDNSFLDVTDYIPTNTGKSRWIHVGVDSSSDPVVTMGLEYDTASTTPYDYMPLEIDDGYLSLAFINLENGMTQVQQRDIIPAPDIFYAPDADSGTDNSANNTLRALIEIGW